MEVGFEMERYIAFEAVERAMVCIRSTPTPSAFSVRVWTEIIQSNSSTAESKFESLKHDIEIFCVIIKYNYCYIVNAKIYPTYQYCR